VKNFLPLLLLLSASAFGATSYTDHYDLAKPAAGDTGWSTSLNGNADTIDSQMYINASTITNHIDDLVGAHEASAIASDVGGAVCTTAEDVQTFLECLDSNIGFIVGGNVMTTNTAQDVTATKTFTVDQVFSAGVQLSALETGVVHSDTDGILSSSLLVNADVDAAAAIAYSKLNLLDSIVDADINSAAAIARSKIATGTAHGLLVNDSGGLVSELGPLTNGQLLIGSTGAAAVAGSITGTANQVTVTPGAGSIALSLPQSIASGSSPTFTGLTLSGLTNGLVKSTTGVLSGGNTVTLTSEVSGVLPLANGGTNKALTAATGGVVYTDADSQEVTAAGTSGQYLKSNGSSAPAFASFTAPTVQRFTSGSGTYTTPAGVLYIKVTVVGAGGGGGGSSTIASANGGNGGTGGNSTFGSTLLVGNGGAGGGATVGLAGTGGGSSVSGPTQILSVFGGGGAMGSTSNTAAVPAYGGVGGSSIFGGAGIGATSGAGAGGMANTGGGGGGASNAQPQYGGSGGGAGGAAIGFIVSPSSSYAYAVGAAGSGGTAGTGGAVGGLGGTGVVIVEEFYN
jgi:hypothetical protein